MPKEALTKRLLRASNPAERFFVAIIGYYMCYYIFMDLPDNIKKLGTLKYYKKGTHLFHEQDLANGFYYVVSGLVKAYRLGKDAKEVVVSRFTNESLVGEIILFVSDEYPVSAEALENTEVLYFGKERFINAMKSDYQIAEYMMKTLAGKCMSLNKRLDTLNIKTPQQRIIQYLLSRCPGNGTCMIDLGMKKGELAQYIGITPEAFSRNLKLLQENKIINVLDNKIKVVNCPELKKLV